MNEFLKNFSVADVIITTGVSTYIECNVEIARVLLMLEGANIERIDIYLDEESNNDKVVIFAEDFV